MDALLTALADPARWRLVGLLAERPRPVGVLAQLAGARQPQTTKHLQTLERAGIVSSQRSGQRRIYSLRSAPLRELAAALSGLADTADQVGGAAGDVRPLRAQRAGRAAGRRGRRLGRRPDLRLPPVAGGGPRRSGATSPSRPCSPPGGRRTTCASPSSSSRRGRVGGSSWSTATSRTPTAPTWSSGGPRGSWTTYVPGERLAYRSSPTLPDGSVAFTAHVDLVLRPTESGTDLDVLYRITGSTADSADFIAGIEIGFGQSLDKLAANIAADRDTPTRTPRQGARSDTSRHGGRRVVANIALSLDGHYAAPDNPVDMSWVVPYAVTDVARDHLTRLWEPATTGVMGRVNAEGFLGFWPTVIDMEGADPRDVGFAKWLVDADKVVFSSSLDEAPWERTTIVDRPAAEAIARAQGDRGRRHLGPLQRERHQGAAGGRPGRPAGAGGGPGLPRRRTATLRRRPAGGPVDAGQPGRRRARRRWPGLRPGPLSPRHQATPRAASARGATTGASGARAEDVLLGESDGQVGHDGFVGHGSSFGWCDSEFAVALGGGEVDEPRSHVESHVLGARRSRAKPAAATTHAQAGQDADERERRVEAGEAGAGDQHGRRPRPPRRRRRPRAWSPRGRRPGPSRPGRRRTGRRSGGRGRRARSRSRRAGTPAAGRRRSSPRRAPGSATASRP